MSASIRLLADDGCVLVPRFSWPSSGQLRRKLEIAVDEGDLATADLVRRLLGARGESVPRAIETGSAHGRQPAPASPSAKARRTDPETSRAAAVAAAPRANTCKGRLLAAIGAAPDGLTAHAASEASGVTYVTASTRLTEMVRDGFLAKTGATRPTANGGSADVLVISADAARSAAA